jgi:hypothetical protein
VAVLRPDPRATRRRVTPALYAGLCAGDLWTGSPVRPEIPTGVRPALQRGERRSELANRGLGECRSRAKRRLWRPRGLPRGSAYASALPSPAVHGARRMPRTTSAITGWSASRWGRMTTPSATVSMLPIEHRGVGLRGAITIGTPDTHAKPNGRADGGTPW